jgi:DNA-binding HxlR family transcriptional regulator
MRGMESHGQYCPIAKGAEVIGDRWTLLIVREMLFGVHHFNELERCLPGISRSVLAQRLKHLERVGIVERESGPSGRTISYSLTTAGRELQPVVHVIGEWGASWAFPDPDPAELDTDLLMRWISRHIAQDQLPASRRVVRFDFTSPRRRYWLVLRRGDASVCLQHPGFDEDVVVTADAATMYDVYLGRVSLVGAIADGDIIVAGIPRDVRAFPRWFKGSRFAPQIRAASERGVPTKNGAA